MIAILLATAIQQDQTPTAPTLLGRCAYLMTGTNKDRDKTVQYAAKAHGEIWQDPKGHSYDSFVWSDLVRDGKPVELPSDPFKEIVTLDQGYKAPFPDLAKSPPALVGPITDLLTFYVDARLAMSLDLSRPGSHAFVKYGKPASWADGSRVILGQDAIDFQVLFKGVDRKTNTASILVRHVPPAEASLSLPTEWMNAPVADAPNNWVEVQKSPDGKYVAAVGKETFDVTVEIGLFDGRIASASQENVVDAVERVCSKSDLSDPGPPTRYKIVRHVELHPVAP